MAGFIDIVPNLKLAVEKENFIRNAAFVLPEERILHFRAVLLTLRRLILLDLMRSPFTSGGVPTPVDVTNFLWGVSPRYAPSAKFARWRLIRSCRRYRRLSEFMLVVKAIQNYVAEAFQDASGAGATQGNRTIYYSYVIALTGVLGRQFGWTVDYVLDLPLKVIFQLLKETTQYSQPKAVLFNPSDQVVAEWLNQVNRCADPVAASTN